MISRRAFSVVTAILSTVVFGTVFFSPSSGPNETFALTTEQPAFSCTSPYHHDGDNIRCPDGPKGRLYGIDAPEMPGACKPGRRCTPGDPIASRDHLRSLTVAKEVRCFQRDVDVYGRVIVQCRTGDIDLSCAQIKSGHAVARYGQVQC